jgi:hypothetical protein
MTYRPFPAHFGLFCSLLGLAIAVALSWRKEGSSSRCYADFRLGFFLRGITISRIPAGSGCEFK